MFGKSKRPRDRTPYPRSSDSHPLTANAAPGRYVFVVDVGEVIHVVPDGQHVHPTVLGGGLDALYAGELFIDRRGSVDELTNLSGTFRFKSKRSLCCVAAALARMGFAVANVVWFPPDGGNPVLLTCG